MRRFDPGFTALRSDVRAGRVGQALLVHCVHRNASSPGATSASVITGSAVHEFDTVRWLLDDEPESVTVHTPRPSSRSAGVQDPVVVVLRMASGALADVEVFVNAGYGYDVRCEVVGEDGAVLLDTPAGTVRRSAGVVGRGIAGDWRARFGEAYRIELQAWVDGDGDGTAVGAGDGLGRLRRDGDGHRRRPGPDDRAHDARRALRANGAVPMSGTSHIEALTVGRVGVDLYPEQSGVPLSQVRPSPGPRRDGHQRRGGRRAARDAAPAC